MAFFEVSNGQLSRIARSSLAEVEIRERRDLQALLKRHISELVPDLLIIAEEFGDWDDSKRRIDLLALDRKANLVVVELKRGDTGVHMELQAIRYAAMVSTMTFDQAVEAYANLLDEQAVSEARMRILSHLGWDEVNEDEFAQDVRIILFSEDFSRELTTSILWLNNNKTMDITAFRIGTYRIEGRLLLEFQQIIPLKEAEDYQVKVRNKQHVEQIARREQIPWNGEFYVSYGGRPWDEAMKFGFISGGGGSWYSQTLNLLSPGDRVWVKIPGTGYVGVGVVEESAQPIDGFMVNVGGQLRRYLDVTANPGDYVRLSDDAEKAEFMVRVKWLEALPETRAFNEPGLFGNQNTVAKPKSPKWAHTVERLKSRFPAYNTSDA